MFREHWQHIPAYNLSLRADLLFFLCRCCAAALFIIRYLATTYIETKRSGVEMSAVDEVEMSALDGVKLRLEKKLLKKGM